MVSVDLSHRDSIQFLLQSLLMTWRILFRGIKFNRIGFDYFSSCLRWCDCTWACVCLGVYVCVCARTCVSVCESAHVCARARVCVARAYVQARVSVRECARACRSSGNLERIMIMAKNIKTELNWGVQRMVERKSFNRLREATPTRRYMSLNAPPVDSLSYYIDLEKDSREWMKLPKRFDT